MKAAWSEIERLERANARHRDGWKLGDAKQLTSLKHAAQELVELTNEPDSLEELADVFGCLIVYAVKQGWSPESVEAALLCKLSQRFHG